MGCRSPLSSAHVLPEGCATSNLGFHATENVGRGYHAHSTRAGRARGDGGRCAHGVRETCAALPMAGHAPCARLVSVRAQFMCATCSDVIGGGCEVTFTRLACENWPGKRHQEIYAALIAVDSTVSVTPLSRGRGKSDCRIPVCVSNSQLDVHDVSGVSLSQYDVQSQAGFRGWASPSSEARNVITCRLQATSA